jgi:hypothetical protein
MALSFKWRIVPPLAWRRSGIKMMAKKEGEEEIIGKQRNRRRRGENRTSATNGGFDHACAFICSSYLLNNVAMRVGVEDAVASYETIGRRRVTAAIWHEADGSICQRSASRFIAKLKNMFAIFYAHALSFHCTPPLRFPQTGDARTARPRSKSAWRAENWWRQATMKAGVAGGGRKPAKATGVASSGGREDLSKKPRRRASAGMSSHGGTWRASNGWVARGILARRSGAYEKRRLRERAKKW